MLQTIPRLQIAAYGIMQQELGIRGKMTLKGGFATGFSHEKPVFTVFSALGPWKAGSFEFPPEKGYIEGAVPGRTKSSGTRRKP